MHQSKDSRGSILCQIRPNQGLTSCFCFSLDLPLARADCTASGLSLSTPTSLPRQKEEKDLDGHAKDKLQVVVSEFPVFPEVVAWTGSVPSRFKAKQHAALLLEVRVNDLTPNSIVDPNHSWQFALCLTNSRFLPGFGGGFCLKGAKHDPSRCVEQSNAVQASWLTKHGKLGKKHRL